MKKVIKIIVLIFIIFTMFINKVDAKTANVYMFYGKTCPHCHEAMEYLDSIESKYDINIIKYEVWENEENAKLMKKVADYLDVNVRGVPFVVIDNTPIIGYSNTTSETYIYHIKKSNDNAFEDKVGEKLGLIKLSKKHSDNFNIKLIDKKIDLSKIDVIISTIIIGIKDSVNLSMTWTILLILCILVNIKNKNKIILIGTSSILISLVLYLGLMLFNFSFDNILFIISNARIITSLIIMVFGIIGLIRFMKNLDEDKKLVIISNNMKIIAFVILSVLLGIISILISLVNQGGIDNMILELIKINNYSNIIYMLLVILYFIIMLITNILVFFILYKLLDTIKLFNKDNKYTLLITSIIILIIGVILGIKPTLLLFNL